MRPVQHKKSFDDWPLFMACIVIIGLIVFGFGVSYAASDRAGDANGDGACNVGDAVYILSYVFKAGPPPVPIEYATAAQMDSLIKIVTNDIVSDGEWPVTDGYHVATIKVGP